MVGSLPSAAAADAATLLSASIDPAAASKLPPQVGQASSAADDPATERRLDLQDGHYVGQLTTTRVTLDIDSI
jgi:hypothetical protein